ncbi:helix-turn-helix domain-containing protein [Flagellimonas olearia]|nr:helix-turn-helix domain-containing protein [Allomuricauda olearia]
MPKPAYYTTASNLDYKEITPGPKLRPYIECFWVCQGNSGQDGYIEEILVPGGRTEIIQADTSFVWYNSEEDRADHMEPGAIILGQRNKVSRIVISQGFRFFGIRFRYGCMPLFIKVSAKEYSNRILKLSDYLTCGEMSLLDNTPPLIDNNFIQDIEHCLFDLIKPPTHDWYILQEIIQSLNNRVEEQTSIHSLAKEHGWNYKKIERVFLKYLGFPPRVFLKIIRFRNALEKMDNSNGSLTNNAYRLGFYDQSHFIREFYNFTGMNPSNFFRETPLLANFLYRLGTKG